MFEIQPNMTSIRNCPNVRHLHYKSSTKTLQTSQFAFSSTFRTNWRVQIRTHVMAMWESVGVNGALVSTQHTSHVCLSDVNPPEHRERSMPMPRNTQCVCPPVTSSHDHFPNICLDHWHLPARPVCRIGINFMSLTLYPNHLRSVVVLLSSAAMDHSITFLEAKYITCIMQSPCPLPALPPPQQHFITFQFSISVTDHRCRSAEVDCVGG